MPKMNADECKKWQPRTTFANTEKLLLFDRLHRMALEQLDGFRAGEHGDGEQKDRKEAIYCAVMDLLGPGVWDVMNS